VSYMFIASPCGQGGLRHSYNGVLCAVVEFELIWAIKYVLHFNVDGKQCMLEVPVQTEGGSALQRGNSAPEGATALHMGAHHRRTHACSIFLSKKRYRCLHNERSPTANTNKAPTKRTHEGSVRPVPLNGKGVTPGAPLANGLVRPPPSLSVVYCPSVV
jgi:hypothetical protein